ncbi:MAG: hypothetical protein SynsKO_29280 [Synoicihabitans sp.]
MLAERAGFILLGFTLLRFVLPRLILLAKPIKAPLPTAAVSAKPPYLQNRNSDFPR